MMVRVIDKEIVIMGSFPAEDIGFNDKFPRETWSRPHSRNCGQPVVSLAEHMFPRTTPNI